MKPTAVTPIAFVHAILRAYERHGKDPAQALAQAQITPAMLQREDTRITAVQMEQISAAAMQELDDEALGWFSRRLPWGSYGMLARASLTSPTLGVALKRWCRHHALLTDDDAMVEQVLSIVQRGVVRTHSGTEIPLQADTVCLHGDTPDAVLFAERLRKELAVAGIAVKAVGTSAIRPRTRASHFASMSTRQTSSAAVNAAA